MSRNSKKGSAEMSRSVGDRKSSKANKVNKYGKTKIDRMSKENQFLSESDSFRSTTNKNAEGGDDDDDGCVDINSEDECEEETNEEASTSSAAVFPFDLAMWDVSLTNIIHFRYKALK